MRLTDETKICESYSISWLFLESSSKQKFWITHVKKNMERLAVAAS